MPSWGAIGQEINKAIEATGGSGILPDGTSVIDATRIKYLNRITEITGRPTVFYGTRWTLTGTPFQVPPDVLSIAYEDVHGFMETLHGLPGDELNIVIHSPGGSPSAAAAIVQYIRSKFKSVTVYVPHMAMSAATMIACASNSIVMAKHSSIGPVDPQITLQTSLGIRMIPAQAIIEQFEQAKRECADPTKLVAWAPMLSQYGPDLLITCENAQKLSKELVSEWLSKWMLGGEADAADKATGIAEWLANHSEFKDHGRPISRDDAIAHGLNVQNLEDNQDLQDAVLSTFHAVTHTFAMTSCAKIIENHCGGRYLKMVTPAA
ncbi:SDH family Clp fold serine proteinase [Brucella pituitosa]|uniref:SDH family Clp fold serine proteinase n=1 Tax=Brucella pituitosa TaxID=571256 RepID=UPI003F4AC3FF